MEGTIVDGRYRIARSIGTGGMAEVYEAEHTDLRRRVALKLVNQKKASAADKLDVWLARFQREARAVAKADTPHVAQVFDAGVDVERGVPYMAMELLTGEDLRALLRRLGTLDPDAAFRIAVQACRGLKQAHEAGVIHRDIKPGNLFLHRHAEGKVVVKVLDFGVAKLVAEPLVDPDSAELTQTGSMLGTPQYMSPEQVLTSKRVDFRTDLWSLGVVLYKMLGGTTPFSRAQTVGQAVLAICTEPFDAVERRAPWLSSVQAEVVARALRRDPESRFSSADEMLNALLAATGGQDELTVDALQPGPKPEPSRSSVPLVSSAGVLRGAHDTETGVTAQTALPTVRTSAAGRGAPRVVGFGVLAALAVIGGVVLFYGPAEQLPTLSTSALREVRIQPPRIEGTPGLEATQVQPVEAKVEAAPVRAGTKPKATPNEPPTEPVAKPVLPVAPAPKPRIDLRPEFE